MIPRRARIKGIANIPARRKADAAIPSNSEENVKTEKTTPEKNRSKPEPNIIELTENEQEIIKTEKVSPKKEPPPKDETTNSKDTALNTPEIKAQETPAETKPAARRWIPKPKPMVSIGAISRRPKPNLVIQKEKQDSTNNNQNIENEIPTDTVVQSSENETSSIKDVPDKQNTSINSSTSESPVCNTTNDLNDSRIRSNSESEKISTTPLSPNKIINRTRIRPSPKLIRRNSVQGSASESEDDTRRTYNRIRNDSVCSTASYTTENLNTSDTCMKHKNISIKVHKLFRRSEQSRKVAEARKEFYTKFGSKQPDRKRLTMMDLIYYNPSTNPMPQPKPNTIIMQDIPIIPINETKEDAFEEEAEDDPSADDPKAPPGAEEEEEECNPVPQVKVGPNGEIILDEQSLVIEQTGTKKGREQLANSKVIDGDDLNRSYGIYKRPKRAREWSATETLRFYRSLNTVGTDFSLMVSLFPGRTRRELKVKFKKEEKLNRSLIDKTLTNPIDFDLSELEQQAKDEEEMEARKKLETENKKKEKKELMKRGPYIRKAGSSFSKTMEEENAKSNTPKSRPKRKIKKDRYSILENGLDDIIDSDSESEDEYIAPSKMARTNQSSRSRRLRKDDSDMKQKAIEVNSESETENNETTTNKETETPNALDLGINLTINEETREVNIFDENQYEDPLIDPLIIVDETSTIQNNTTKDTDKANENETISNEKTTETIIINDNEDETTTNNNNKDKTAINEINKDETTISENKDETTTNDIKDETTINDNNKDETINANKNEKTKEITNDDDDDVLPADLSSVEPGSLMILQTEGENGKPVYKVFMVTADQQKVEINLGPDVINSLTSSLGSDEVVTLDLPVVNKTNNSEGKSELILS